ncbi:MAG: hypothetical protein ACI9N1_000990, partial [Flavobacteriales bacterium]
WGQKKYPIPYNLRKMSLYLGLAFLIFLIRSKVGIYEPFSWLEFFYNNFLILLYLITVVFFEKTLWNLVSKKLLKRK